MILLKDQNNALLSDFNSKIVSKSNLFKSINNVMQDEELTNRIISSFRKNKAITYIFQKYYYINSENERISKVKLYSIFELIATILNKLKINWYFGLNTANELNKIVWQNNNIIIVINDRFHKKITVENQKINFIKIKSSLIFDYKKYISKNRIQLRISSLEKTFLDFEYLQRKIPFELKNKVDNKKLDKLKESLL